MLAFQDKLMFIKYVLCVTNLLVAVWFVLVYLSKKAQKTAEKLTSYFTSFSLYHACRKERRAKNGIG